MTAPGPLKLSFQWRDEIAERIGHKGQGVWLHELGEWMELKEGLPPQKPERFHIASSSFREVSIKLHDPGWETHETVEDDEWVLYEATLIAYDDLAHLPFGLFVTSETPQSAMAKLSTDASPNGRLAPNADACSVTYFLKDHRAVVVTFRRGLVGIRSILVTRLFDWPDWRMRKPKQ